jgi:hypothetical protein
METTISRVMAAPTSMLTILVTAVIGQRETVTAVSPPAPTIAALRLLARGEKRSPRETTMGVPDLGERPGATKVDNQRAESRHAQGSSLRVQGPSSKRSRQPGREQGREGIEAYTGLETVIIQL